MWRGLGPSRCPQAEQICEDGKARSTLVRVRPYRDALYSSMVTNADQPASCTDFASLVRARPFTLRLSTLIAWFSRISFVDNLW
jgi:hypothetical protein